MLDPAAVSAVAADETLARFILRFSHVRHDRTVKPDAFVPHPLVELSVTRHREATAAELWNEGMRVASLRDLRLYGRADVQASNITAEQLTIVPKPIPRNPNHADVIGWPDEKPQQKMKALEIARKSTFVSPPTDAQSGV